MGQSIRRIAMSLFKRRGFTLLELITVVSIIGIIASIAVPMISTLQTKAKLTEAFTIASGFKSIMCGIIAEYGWDFNSPSFVKAFNSARDSYLLITCGNAMQYCYVYGINYGINLDTANNRVVVSMSGKFTTTGSASLCTWSLYQDGSEKWYVYENTPWTNQLKAIIPPGELASTP